MTRRITIEIDDRKRLRLSAIEGKDGLFDRHARQQHLIAVVEKILDRLVRRCFGRMNIRQMDQPDIAVVLVDGDHVGRRAERKSFAERRHIDGGVHRLERLGASFFRR